MDDKWTTASQQLSKNIEFLRKSRKLSQAQLAQLAAIPRTTLTHMESGEGNPSLRNLLKLATALQVSIEELLVEKRKEVEVYRKSQIPVKSRKGGMEIYKLLPDPIPGMEMDRMDLEPGARMKGTPHLPKTKEYFYCLQGSFEIYIHKAKYEINKGDLLAFPGDSPHAYINPSSQVKASGFSVVVLNYG